MKERIAVLGQQALARLRSAWQLRVSGRMAPLALGVAAAYYVVVVRTGQGQWPSTTPGWVQVLDGRTGRRLRTVAVGRGPAALAVEECSDHVFVANSYGTPTDPGSMSRLVAWGRSWLPGWVRRDGGWRGSRNRHRPCAPSRAP